MFETILLSAIGVCFVVLVACLVSLAISNRRRRQNPLFARRPSLVVSTKPVLDQTVVEGQARARASRQAPTVAERPRFDMRTLDGMF